VRMLRAVKGSLGRSPKIEVWGIEGSQKALVRS
jgi:hypothetical protein